LVIPSYRWHADRAIPEGVIDCPEIHVMNLAPCIIF
jgi:hypothetical protein